MFVLQGFGPKKWPLRLPLPPLRPDSVLRWSQGRALVVGGGVAGLATAAQLAKEGMKVRPEHEKRPSLKTNMTMETQPWTKIYLPIENGVFSIEMVIFDDGSFPQLLGGSSQSVSGL